MTRYLIIDTETSGLPDFAKPAEAEGQPRLCSIALILADERGEEIGHGAEHYLIKPDGWEISPEITAINGLTTERCEAEGVPITTVLARYTDLIERGHVVIAYNSQFDTKIMRGELRRAGMPDLFEQTPNVCAMRACKQLNIEKAGEKKSGFPKLTDTYRHFFKAEVPDNHTALGDARACLMIWRELIKMGAAPAPEVHYAKEGSKSHEALKARQESTT